MDQNGRHEQNNKISLPVVFHNLDLSFSDEILLWILWDWTCLQFVLTTLQFQDWDVVEASLSLGSTLCLCFCSTLTQSIRRIFRNRKVHQSSWAKLGWEPAWVSQVSWRTLPYLFVDEALRNLVFCSSLPASINYNMGAW